MERPGRKKAQPSWCCSRIYADCRGRTSTLPAPWRAWHPSPQLSWGWWRLTNTWTSPRWKTGRLPPRSPSGSTREWDRWQRFTVCFNLSEIFKTNINYRKLKNWKLDLESVAKPALWCHKKPARLSGLWMPELVLYGMRELVEVIPWIYITSRWSTTYGNNSTYVSQYKSPPHCLSTYIEKGRAWLSSWIQSITVIISPSLSRCFSLKAGREK